jgi:hypothetical protein
MRPAVLLCLLVMLVTSRFVRADAPMHATMTSAAPPSPPPLDVVAVTRVQGLALRTLQPRLTLRTPLLPAVRLTPMFPVGAFLNFEYTLGKP